MSGNVYRIFMGNREGKRPLLKPRRRWEDGIRMVLRDIGWGSVDWIQLDPVAGSCEYGDEPSGSGATELDVRADIVMDVYLRTEEVLNYTILCVILSFML
jgi:hypothetical protein